MVGERIGNYRVVRKLGQGGMGMVFEAVHDQLTRRVAIKVLLTDFSKKPQITSRFFNEARAVNIVQHPGLVNIFEMGQLPDGCPYIVMEYLDGQTLGARLSGGGTPPRSDVVRLLRQVATALAAAHRKGIIHRDLKPDNVMVVPDPEAPSGERVKVLDFGLAKVVAEVNNSGMNEVNTHLKTHSGMLLGTPSYMAPEQCRGAGEVTDKADVYSLGVMFYQFLAGRLPFVGQGPMEVIAKAMYETPLPLRALVPAVPEEMAALVHCMMDKSPEARPSMERVVLLLEQQGAPKASGPQAPIEISLSDISTDSVAQMDTVSRAGSRWWRRRWVRIAVGCLLGVLTGGALVVGWPHLKGPVQTAPPDMAERADMYTESPRDAGVQQQPDLARPIDLMAGPRMAHCDIRTICVPVESTRCGAEVWQLPSAKAKKPGKKIGKKIGKTPFDQNVEAPKGKVYLQLWRDEYFESDVLAFDSSNCKRIETLFPKKPRSEVHK